MRFVDVFTLISYTYSHLNIFHFFSKKKNHSTLLLNSQILLINKLLFLTVIINSSVSLIPSFGPHHGSDDHTATWRVVNTSVTDSPWHEDGFVVSYVSLTHGLINYKDTKTQCRLY